MNRSRNLLGAALITAIFALVGIAMLIAAVVSDLTDAGGEYGLITGLVRSCDGMDYRVPTCEVVYELDGAPRTSLVDFEGFSVARVGDSVQLRVSEDGNNVGLAENKANRYTFTVLFTVASASLVVMFLVLRRRLNDS